MGDAATRLLFRGIGLFLWHYIQSMPCGRVFPWPILTWGAWVPLGRRRQFLAVFLFSLPRTAKANLAFNVRVASSIGVQGAAQMFAHIVVFAAIGINFSPMHNVYMCKIIVIC